MTFHDIFALQSEVKDTSFPVGCLQILYVVYQPPPPPPPTFSVVVVGGRGGGAYLQEDICAEG
jgi:hypothetical protein